MYTVSRAWITARAALEETPHMGAVRGARVVALAAPALVLVAVLLTAEAPSTDSAPAAGVATSDDGMIHGMPCDVSGMLTGASASAS